MQEIRRFCKEMLDQRRIEMQSKDFVNSGDVLTSLILDETFKDQEEWIVDECVLLMVAGTNATTRFVYSTLYHLIVENESR